MRVQSLAPPAFVAFMVLASVSLYSQMGPAADWQEVLVSNQSHRPLNITVQGIIRTGGIAFSAGPLIDLQRNITYPAAGLCQILDLPAGQKSPCTFHSSFEKDFDVVHGFDSTAYSKLVVTVTAPYHATWECPASTTKIRVSADGGTCEHQAGVWYP